MRGPLLHCLVNSCDQKTEKYIMVELVFKEQLQQDQALHLPAVPVTEKS